MHWLLVTTQENERKVRRSLRKRRKTCVTIIVRNRTRNLSTGNRCTYHCTIRDTHTTTTTTTKYYSMTAHWAIERFRGTIFRAKIRMGATDFFQACSIRFFGTRIRVDWLSYEPCFVWRFCVIGCRKIFRVQIWYEKHRFFAGSFDFGTNFQNKKA